MYIHASVHVIYMANRYPDPGPDPRARARAGMFSFSSVGDRSFSGTWSATATPGPSTQHQWSGDDSLSFRAPENIRKSLAALDEVVTPSTTTPTPFTPGSLLKESFRAGGRSRTFLTGTPGLTPQQDSNLLGGTSLMGTPGIVSMSLMDSETSQQPLIMTTIREDDTLAGHSFLSTGLFGGDQPSQQHVTSDDPVQQTTHDLLKSFHHAYADHTHPSQCLQLVALLQEACNDQITVVKDKSSDLTTLTNELNLERSTWELLEALYTDRLSEEDMEQQQTEEECHHSHKEVADEFFSQNPNVRQTQLVVDWLENNAIDSLDKYSLKTNYMTDSVGWENTQHSLERDRDTQRLVTQLDPDAPRREGRRLAELDETDEETLLKHLFTCLRAGQVAKAQEMCVAQGQSWRAATLEGWRLHHDPNYGKNMLHDEMESVEGNATRDLWKLCTWQLASDTEMHVYERAVYASLSGNVRQILPVCNTWLDCVWAYFKSAVDVLTERCLRAATTDQPQESLPPDYWNITVAPEIIFQEIEASPKALVINQSKNPFHILQKYIILGNLDGLVSVMHGWLAERPTLYQLRFITHLCLLAQSLGEVPSEDDRCNDILQAYIKEMVSQKFYNSAALYTARLPPSLQVPCYAALLEDIEDPVTQRECLELGSQVGLDIALITKSVVEHVKNAGQERPVRGAGPELLPLTDTEITKLDNSKIEVIKWLIYDKGQRSEAIHQGNALMRQFIATRKLSAAEALFDKLPADSVDVVCRAWASKEGDSPLSSDLANDIHEYQCIQSYLECQQKFNNWFHHYHRNKPEPPPEPTHDGFRDNVTYNLKLEQYQADKDVWNEQLTSLSDNTRESLYKVLVCDDGWMVDPRPCEEVDERRAAQLVLLRELCLPQIAFLLHTVLHSSNLTRECLKLADIVASEQYQLYKVFRKHELQHLLSLLSQSAMDSLADRQSDLGYPL